ncbi:hypothetical protein PSACC_01937 [Paramicrosporidium saccamoebae]|uniref:Uncharacterized protein n=1 Tax=Paramicrosporidium saccamoebae TaxID=1246581 RepID=A0A2H9TKH5_9FUNG|nr:hypothetical protein PSACC_01937 [Paramicrosporidium saccamoebae]
MALKENGLETRDLLFMDNVLSAASKAQNTLNVVLVDHNEPSGRWHRKYPGLKPRVCSIIDHHEDAGHFLDAVPRIVKVCGSTASLIVEMAKNGKMTERLEHLARLLLQTIIFDTVNLTWRQKPIDIDAVRILSSSFTQVQQEGTNVMHELEEAISSVPEDRFGIYDLLYKDYKLYVHHPKNSVIYYGISTFHVPFSVMIGTNNENLDSWVGSVQRFMADEDIQLLLMTNSIRERGSTTHSQQFAIFSKPENPAIVAELYELLQSKDVRLELIVSGANFALPLETGEFITGKSSKGIIVSYDQHNRSDVVELPELTWDFAVGSIARYSKGDVDPSTVERPADTILVCVYTTEFAECSFREEFQSRVDNAKACGATPSFLMRKDAPIRTISIVEMVGNERVRHDNITVFEPLAVLQHGCLGIIQRDQLYQELLYILDKAPKYGA